MENGAQGGSLKLKLLLILDKKNNKTPDTLVPLPLSARYPSTLQLFGLGEARYHGDAAPSHLTMCLSLSGPVWLSETRGREGRRELDEGGAGGEVETGRRCRVGLEGGGGGWRAGGVINSFYVYGAGSD